MKKFLCIGIGICLATLIAVLGQQTTSQLITGGAPYGSMSDGQVLRGDTFLLTLIAGGTYTAASLVSNSASYAAMSDRQIAQANLFLLNQIGGGSISNGFLGTNVSFNLGNSNNVYIAKDDLGRSALSITDIGNAKYKWMFDIGPLNYGNATANGYFSATNSTTNAIIKDLHMWLEPNYFFDINEIGEEVGTRQQGTIGYDTNILFSATNGSYGTAVYVPGISNFPTISLNDYGPAGPAGFLGNQYTIASYDGNFRASHIESQLHPYSTIMQAGVAISGMNGTGLLTVVTNGSVAAGTGATATIVGTDVSFILRVTTGGTGQTSGPLCTVGFVKWYAQAPMVVLTATNILAATNFAYISATTRSNFTVSCSLAAPAAGNTMAWNGHVIQ